ncbi:MAG: HAMP domain-containing histidine kinase [Clostridia bacterium]|nr:HAMP domain-containing histidine kinase [Clostridia bacterium]
MRGGKKSVGTFIMRHSKMGIVLTYNVVTLVIGIVFFPILPVIMGYPPGFLPVTQTLGTSYLLQYIVILVLAITTGTVALITAFKGLGKWSEFIASSTEYTKQLQEIRKKCINIPYLIYIFQIFFISIPIILVMIFVYIITKIPVVTLLKIITAVFSFFSLAAIVSHTFSKRIFTQILLKTYKGEELQGIRISLRKKIFLQMLPISIVAILFTGMLGYSRLMEEKGDLVYKICKNYLFETVEKIGDAEEPERIFETLKGLEIEGTKISYFVVTEKGKFIASDGYKPTAFFNYYVKNPLNGDRIYGDTTEVQGVETRVKGKNGDFLVGIRFEVASERTVVFFLAAFFILLIFNIFVLYFFSKSLSGEISLVADSLTEIAEGEYVDLDRKLAVVSNDELADLVISFNKIQEREKEHIREIEEKHAIMMEQERLASLGQLIGGIAHNLRTPIMSIAGAIEGLKDLIKEYDESIDDEKVTREDHHEIAKEMKSWIEKMKPYCTYMSDIITAVKGQTVQKGNQEENSFTLYELHKRIEILFEYELRKQHCKLNTVYNMDMDTRIQGDISVLVQVLNNLIVNAVDAYDSSGGNIELTVNRSEKVIEFIVRDHGRGIPADLQSKLFKEMVTTKGTKGTGLGLYMSYSNIKARFCGKMRFESEEGKGTAFYIYIPVK